MKKIIAMAAMLSAVVVFAYTYRLQTLAWLQLPAFAVTDKNISETLKSDEDPGEDKDILSMRSCTEDETLYRRANRYYIGDKKDSVDITYPLFAQEGTALYYLNGDFNLITSDFESYESYDGLLLSNGTAYETDGQVAEEEEYILSSAGKGLYINAQPMKLSSAGNETNIRLNSIMYLGDSGIHYYSFEDGHLVYGQTRVSYGETVSIGSVSMTYDAFLKQLGLLAEYGSGERGVQETESPTEENDLNHSRQNQRPAGGSGNPADGETVSAEQLAGEQETPTIADSAYNQAEDETGEVTDTDGNADGSGETFDNSDSGDLGGAGGSDVSDSGSSGGSSGGGSSSGSSSGNSGGSGSGSGSGSGTSSGSGSGTGDGTISGGGNSADNGGGDHNADGDTGTDTGSGNATAGDPDIRPEEYKEPTAVLSDITMGVYGMTAKLDITDEQSRLVRAVFRFSLDGTQKSRKNMKKSGNLEVTNLEPGKTYQLTGEIVFRNNNGIKETKPFMEAIEVTTLPMSTLRPMRFTFAERDTYFSNKVGVDKILAEDVPTSDGRISAISYIGRIEVSIDGEDYNIGGSAVRNIKRGIAANWLSKEGFDSNKTYHYTVSVLDRFRNKFELTSDSVTEGTTHTCKVAPTASIRETANTVGAQSITVQVSNPDHADMENCYLYIVNTEGDDVPAFDETGDGINTKYRRAVSTDGTTNEFTITNLPSGTSFYVIVRADYELNDKNTKNWCRNTRIGRLSMFTAQISLLGNAHVNLDSSDITDSSFTIGMQVDTTKTMEGLLTLMDRFPVQITSDSKTWENETILSRSELEKVSVEAGSTSIVIQNHDTLDATVPKVVISGTAPEDVTDAWSLFISGWRAEFQFQEGKGQDNPFDSMTNYTVSVGAVASQGGSEYKVQAPTNTLQIRTLKQTAGFRHDGVFTLSDFVELYHFYFDDPDGAIDKGAVTVKLYSVSEASLVETRTIKVNTEYESLRFNNLKMDHEYRIEFTAQNYNVYYENGKNEQNYTFPDKVFFKTGEGITGSLDMKSIDESGSGWKASVTVQLTDRKQELKNGTYTLLLKGADGMDVDSTKLDEIKRIPYAYPYETAGEEGVTLEEIFNCNGFSTYEVDLLISVRGYEDIVLARVNFTTETGMDTISNWQELRDKLMANPNGKFVVVADIERTGYEPKDAKGNSYNKIFSGTLDFQGHTLSFPEETSYGPVFNSLTSTGVIENIVFDYRRDPSSPFTQSAGLVNRNYGTIRNIVMKINMGRSQPNWYTGLMTFVNEKSGVIENFSVKIEKELHARSSFGIVTATNNGTIRKGAVYGKNVVLESLVYGGDIHTASGVYGAIAYSNSATGVIEDVFVLNNAVVEYNVNYKGDYNYTMDYTGGIVGSADGTVRNSFFVGDIFYFSYDANGKQSAYQVYNRGGATIGYKEKSINTSNLYHISQYTDATYPKDAGQSTVVQRLWDTIWYENVFLSPDSFEIDGQVASGYYPKVQMSESMSMQQENVALPAAPGANIPEYVSSKVVSQPNNKEAEVLLYFRSNNLQKINRIEFSGLTTEILSQGLENGMYVVRAKVSDPQTFSSKYLYSRLTYEINETTHDTTSVDCGNDGKYLEINFYHEIASYDDWKSIDANPGDNYLLVKDLDFDGMSIGVLQISPSTATFTGKLDGGGHTIRNISGVGSFLIQTVTGGEIKNLNFENIEFLTHGVTDNLVKSSEAGIFGRVTNNSVLKNIRISDVKLSDMPAHVGGLVSYLEYSTMEDCRAEHVTITTAANGNNAVAVGGLLGYGKGIKIYNSYASNINIKAQEGARADGIGGLVGCVETNGTLSNVYTHGTITTAFGGTGGIEGAGSADVSQGMSYVNITSTAGDAGGILGIANSSISLDNLLSIGNISGSGSNIGRIYGNTNGSTVSCAVTNGAAYSGQLVGVAVSDKELTATYLSMEGELAQQGLYRNRGRLGNSFDIEGTSGYHVEDSYMPQLKNVDGEILPEQTAIELPDENLKVTSAEISEYSGAYTVEVIAENGGNGFLLDRIVCDGMDFSQITDNSIPERLTLIYRGVLLKKYQSVYPAVAVFKKGDIERRLDIQIQAKSGTVIARTIHNAEEWTEAMNEAGQNFENFRIAGDIVLSDHVANKNIPMGLKINSLIGETKLGGGKYTITFGGKQYDTASAAESMFTVIAGEMSNLKFTDITINNGTRSGTNFGLIATNQGKIENCEFENIKLVGYQATNVGMIGTNTGNVKNVQLKDIDVSVSATSIYVGGLIGYNTGNVSQITAEGNPVNNTLPAKEPAESSFTYRVSAPNSNNVGGIIGASKTALTDLSIKGAYVNGYDYVGGITGRLAQCVTSENLTVGEEEYPVYIAGRNYIGGVGSQYSESVTVSASLKNVTVQYAYVSGSERTAGVLGATTWYNTASQCVVDHCYVNGAKENTGGIVSSSVSVQNSIVRDSVISGTSNVGGITGSRNNSTVRCAVENTTVEGSGDNIGGIIGGSTDYQMSVYSDAVTGCVIRGTGSSSSGVGGIVGKTDGTSTDDSRFTVSNTKVTGATGVGGIVGITYGGKYSWINCDAEVEATGSGAGSFAGILYDYYYDAKGGNSNPHAYVKEAVLGGTVKAVEQAGSFVGRLTNGNPRKDSSGEIIDQGHDYLSSEQYNKIILTADVNGNNDNSSTVWGYFHLDNSEFTDMSSWKPSKSIGEIQTVGSTAPSSVVWGGIKINDIPLWNNITEWTGTGKAYAKLELPVNKTDATVKDDPKAIAPYQYFVTDAEVFERAALYQTVLGFNKNRWVYMHIQPDKKANRAARFPYVTTSEEMYPNPKNTTGGNTMLSNYQDGTMGYWGLAIPTGATTSTLSLRDITDEQYLWVSASGPASITLELSSDVVGAAMSVADGSGEVLRVDNTTERVYTMPYNYSTPLVVTLSAPEIGFTQTYDILAQDLASSVMAWKGDQYYLTNSGIRSASGKSIAGSFLNLRNGQALDLNGDIWNVESGSVVSHCDFTDIQWEEPKAVCEFTYDGEKLSVYHQFIHYDGEDLDRLAYVKNGTLFGLEPDPDMVYGAVLADTYQDSQYLTVLGTDGLLHDLNESIHLPEGFTNRGIVELADNMHDDSHIAIGRYEDGKVFAFNYLTGTELTLEEADSWENGTDLSLADYAGQYLESYLGSWFGMNNSGYAASANLMTNLSTGRLGSLDDILSYTGTASEGGEAAGTSGKAGGNGSAADSDSDDPDKKNSSSDHNEKDDSTQTGDREKSRNSIVDAVKSLFSKTADDEKNGVSTSKDETSESKKEKTNGTDESKDEKDSVTKKNSSGENDADASKDLKEKTVQDGSGTSKNENAANDQTENRDLTEKDAAASLGDLTEKQETADKSHAEKNGSEKDSAADSESVASGEKVYGEKASDDLISDQLTSDQDTTDESSGTSGSAESKETEAVANAAEAETTAGSETAAVSETAGSDLKSSAVTEKKLITVYNPADGSYRIYTAKDYLSQTGDSLTSVDSKVKEMASQGLIADQTQLKSKDFMEDKKYGIMIFGAFSAMGILLSLGLLLKKREGRK